jgi:hypothetical protein
MSKGIIGIEATPTHATVNAILTAIPEPSALLTYVPDKAPATGRAALYSYIQGSVYKIDPKAKAHREMKLVSKVQRIWNQAKELAMKQDANATEIEVTALPNPDAPDRDIISISYRDTVGKLKHASAIPPLLIKRIGKLRTLLRPNRDIHAPEPLKISVPGKLPKSCSEFMNTQFKDFEAGLKDPDAKMNALRNIVTAEALIQGFSTNLKGLIERKGKELDSMPLLPHPVRKKKMEEQKKLKKLQTEINSIDRNAVFRAVATWNNMKSGGVDSARIREVADIVTLDTRRDLLKGGVETTEAHVYALDVGDLLIAEQWDAQLRREETDRDGTKSCVEHLVVQMMMNLQELGVREHPILEGLGEEVVEPQRAYARAVYDQMGKMEILGRDVDLETKLNAIRNRKDLSQLL